jgi:hypothetical protein
VLRHVPNQAIAFACGFYIGYGPAMPPFKILPTALGAPTMTPATPHDGEAWANPRRMLSSAYASIGVYRHMLTPPRGARLSVMAMPDRGVGSSDHLGESELLD